MKEIGMAVAAGGAAKAGPRAIRRPAEPAFVFGPLDFIDRAFNYPLDHGLAPMERDRGDTEPENGS
ncbi:hypothetical protein [Phreatobacter cathodiphilus]|uniref:hypothetical protein n=1 Tax=Phreatobacter cathodiphilus TaxID=1868589 RepID=UPI0011B229EE|nr:hypothetical protein [Phreatobacter cathodiphilus]